MASNYPNQPTFQGGDFNALLALQFEQPSLKRKPEYGLKLVKSLWSQVNDGFDGYYSLRNKKWTENANFAKGVLDHAELMQSIGIDTKEKSVIKTIFTMPKVIPRYKQATLGSFMNRDEKPVVRTSDILSEQQKGMHKMLAKYRMDNKEKIAALQQASGMQLEDGITHEDEDEMELYYKLEFRLPEEMYFEKTVDKIIQNSGYEDLKRQILSDLIDCNLACTKLEKLNYGDTGSMANRMKIRRCKPKRTIYNIFESPVGKDISLIGEAYPITIAEARRRNPQITETEWFELAKKAQTGQNLRDPLRWQDTYQYQFNRPYDDYKIFVFDFEVKVVDKDYYVKTENQYGSPLFIAKKGKPNPQKGEAMEETKLNIYQGCWAIGTDIMLDWDIAPNMIRPYQNGVDCFFNYSIVCPDADGTLVPSLMEKGIPMVRNIISCALKIQQMQAEMKPSDIAVDVAGLRDIDLGVGEVLQPLQVMKVYDTKGRIYYDSTDTSGAGGEGTTNLPFKEIPNSGNAAQINTLVQLYNFWLQRLNDEWGVNADSLGQQVAAKRSVGVNQNQIQAANNAIEYIYDHFLNLMEQNASKIAMTLWDMIIFEAGEYKLMDGIADQLIDKTFDVSIEMLPKAEGKARLQDKINIALQEKTITLGQSIRLESMENVKDAELWLMKMEKKAQDQAAAAQQQNIQMNAQVQEQSLQSKAQADAYVQQAKAKAEAMVNAAKSVTDDYSIIVKMISQLRVEEQINGKPMSDEMKQLAQDLTMQVLQKAQPQPQQQDTAQQQQQQPDEQEQVDNPQEEQMEPQSA